MIDVITFAFIVLIWLELYRIRKTLEKLAKKNENVLGKGNE